MSAIGLSLRDRREKLSSHFRKKENDLLFRKSRFKHKAITFPQNPSPGKIIETDFLLESLKNWIVWLNSADEWDEQKVIEMQEFLRENMGILDKLKREPMFQEISSEMSFELLVKKIVGSINECACMERLWHICAWLTILFTCRISAPTCMALFRIIQLPSLPQKDMENLLIILINFYSDSSDTLDQVLFSIDPWESIYQKLDQLLQHKRYSEITSLLDFLNVVVFKAFVNHLDSEISEALLDKFQKLTQMLWEALPDLPNQLQVYSFLVWVLYAKLLSHPNDFLTPQMCENAFNFFKVNSNNIQAIELMFTYVDLLGDYLDPGMAKSIIYPQLQSIVLQLKKVLAHRIIDLRQNGLQVLSNMFAVSYDVFLVQSIQAEGIAQMTIEAFRQSNDYSFQKVCLRFLDNYIKGVQLGESSGHNVDLREDLDLVDALFDKLKHSRTTPADMVLQYLDSLECLLERSSDIGYWKPGEESEIIRFISNNLLYIHSFEELMFDSRKNIREKAESIIDEFLREYPKSRGFNYFHDD